MIGALSVGYYVSAAHQKKLANPDFLRQRLDAVENGDDVSRASSRPASLIRVQEARRDTVGSIRAFYGRLVEVQMAKISTEVSGLVVELPIEVGQRVVGGETLIAQIDKTWIELDIEQTEAEVKILEAQFAHQTSEAQRLESLALSRAVSESELNNQRTIVEQFRRNLEKSRIAAREAKEKFKRTTILAPFDGYIVRRDTGLGELLSPGMPIAEIVSLGNVDAKVFVTEDVVDRITIGDEIPINVDPLGMRVVGKVRSVVPYGPTGSRSFPILVRLEDRDGQLKVGMSVTALVATTDPREEIVVSKDAVLDKPDGALVWVAVKDEASAEEVPDDPRYIAKPVPVKLTARTVTEYGVQAETDEGEAILVAGAKTIIEGAERLVPNQSIRIVEIDPAIMENLPASTGQKVIAPKQRVGL